MYVIPANSTSMKPDKTEVYEILEKELCSFSAQGDILIGGDFNSRLGKKYKGFISYDSETHFPVGPSDHLDLVLLRNFKYINNNSYGKLLSELCLTHNLMILNSRTMGDFTGKYTCFRYNGNSTVDLILTDKNVQKKVKYFKVLSLTE